ncbi:hypothetical protein J416_14502 [Gracilibacillus halophilus YIM-C55.5]|uniref:CamS family sex pheromone protein n=1 Tax=Gracilibacillus halophilus YIM-C55.5 TaxID=1308866 RepID=N4WHS3_9BACI|nr:CamS family sex pheromone protein [Gracilibacillus halophilus]ENH95727.1 hypothetical protein J416_14502 [Gracilibacillus halophilus YIM-C55.5]
MKKSIVSILVMVLVLAGCAPSFNESDEEVVDETVDDSEQETAIIPNYNVSQEQYRVLVDSKLSQARGVITNQIANRIDIDAMEEGLRRLSKDVYAPSDHYFQEGQYITEDTLYSWLERYDEEDHPKGLNPVIENASNQEQQRNNPKYLSHILEQNYLTRTEDDVVELQGISLALAMKSVYRFQTETGGPYYYETISKEKMLSEANNIADEVLQRVRDIEGLENVPVFLTVYREAEQNSLVPGNYVAKASVSGDETSVNNWESVNEEHVLFTSGDDNENYPDTSALINELDQDVSDYFPNYVSVIGKGFYIDNTLQELTIEIPVSFYGKAELTGFTQYVYGLVKEGFPNSIHLEVNITSGDQQEALIVRKPGEEDGFVHIYR